jgi:Homeodomain-like domain
MRVCGMREGIVVDVSAADRARLEAVVANRNSPQKHVWRARIVLLTAEGPGTVEIMRRTGKNKTAVWRWQERYMVAGVDGLLRDKTRPSPIPPTRRSHLFGVSLPTTTRERSGDAARRPWARQ